VFPRNVEEGGFISQVYIRAVRTCLAELTSHTSIQTQLKALGIWGSLCLRLSHYIRSDVPKHHRMDQSGSEIRRAHLVSVVSLSLGGATVITLPDLCLCLLSGHSEVSLITRSHCRTNCEIL